MSINFLFLLSCYIASNFCCAWTSTLRTRVWWIVCLHVELTLNYTTTRLKILVFFKVPIIKRGKNPNILSISSPDLYGSWNDRNNHDWLRLLCKYHLMLPGLDLCQHCKPQLETIWILNINFLIHGFIMCISSEIHHYTIVYIKQQKSKEIGTSIHIKVFYTAVSW